MSMNYSFRVDWSEEDEVFLARCVELPSIVAHGDSRTEALKEAETAVEASVAWLKEEHEQIPEPISSNEFSGKLSLRMDPDLHRRIALRAAEKQVSINHLITTILASNLDADQIDQSVERLRSVTDAAQMELPSLVRINNAIQSIEWLRSAVASYRAYTPVTDVVNEAETGIGQVSEVAG